MIKESLQYQKMGLSVVPLHPPTMEVDIWGKEIKESSRGKVPMCRWTDWQTKQASKAQIRQWWSKWPTANIGIITGKEVGISVIDVDTEDHKLIKKLKLPATAIVKSGRGYHYWYKYPIGYEVNGNINKPPGFPFIEIGFRSANRVAPPSVHYSGHQYSWLTPPPCSVSELSDFPLELLDLLGVEKGKSQLINGRVSQITKLDNIPDGEKHNAFMDLFTRIVKVSPTEEFEQLWKNALLWNECVCSPPMPVKDLRKRFDWLVDKESKGRVSTIPPYTDDDAPPTSWNRGWEFYEKNTKQEPNTGLELLASLRK